MALTQSACVLVKTAQQRQELEGCSCKPRNARMDGHHGKMGGHKEGFYQEPQRSLVAPGI